MAKASTKITYDAAGNPEDASLPPLGQLVLVCTVRPTPLPTDDIYAAYAKCKFNKDAMNAMLERTVHGHPHPQEVAAELAKHPKAKDYTRSAWVEAKRIRAADREKSNQKFVGEWAWASDAMPLVEAHALIPTHWAPTPELAP